jgi:hypothetical protein
VLHCRLTYARQRIRELEALLGQAGVTLPPDLTEVPSADHDCFAGQ